MLEPLMTTDEKLARNKADKETGSTVPSTPVTEVVLDMPITDQQSVDATSSLPLTDADVSFDIGGIDLPDFDAVTAETTTDDVGSTGGMFLSGGKVLSATESSLADDVSTSDISIGLLQGATAGTSDAIMDATPPVALEVTLESAITEPIIDLATPITISEPESLVKMEEVPPTELQMDHVFSAGSSLMDMLGDMPVSDVIMPTITEAIAPEAPIAPETTPSLLNPDTMTQSSQTTEATDIAIETPLFSDSLTDDSAILSVITPVIADENSPLHEMLREFIAKLEKLESESDVLDTKAATAQSRIQAKRIKLEDEYHARLSAIEAEQLHITGGKAARQEEKSKLRKIIENLEKEIA
jgi:hypothetical protein